MSVQLLHCFPACRFSVTWSRLWLSWGSHSTHCLIMRILLSCVPAVYVNRFDLHSQSESTYRTRIPFLLTQFYLVQMNKSFVLICYCTENHDNMNSWCYKTALLACVLVLVI